MTTKAYRETNRDKIKEYMKRYRKGYKQRNKDKIRAYRSEKIQCPCGSSVTRHHYYRHKHTKKHERYQTSMFAKQM